MHIVKYVSLTIGYIHYMLFLAHNHNKNHLQTKYTLFIGRKSLWEAKSARVRPFNFYFIMTVSDISIIYINMVCVLTLWIWYISYFVWKKQHVFKDYIIFWIKWPWKLDISIYSTNIGPWQWCIVITCYSISIFLIQIDANCIMSSQVWGMSLKPLCDLEKNKPPVPEDIDCV